MSFASQFMQLLPQGKAWPRSLASNLYKLALSVAPEFGRVDDAAGLLHEREFIPSTSVDLLPDHERVFGLPDACTPLAQTLEERQAAVAARLEAQGNAADGTSPDTLIAIAATLGYDGVIIRRFTRKPFNCDSPCNAPVADAAAGWTYRWDIEVEHGANDELLQCELERIGLEHLELSFVWPLLKVEDMTYSMSETSTHVHPVTGEANALAIDEPGENYIGV